MEKKKSLMAIPLIALVIFALISEKVLATTVVNYRPEPYDEQLNIYHAHYGTSRPPQNKPAGQWYCNTNFDPDPSNYAIVGSNGLAKLRAYSTAIFIPDCHGWSNAFFHQGRIPYSGGIYEGKFKIWTPNGETVADGIEYPFVTDYETGKHFITVRVRVTKRYVNQAFAFASVLLFFLFQYKFSDGSLSPYDSPAKTSYLQSLHYDVFLSRARRTAWIYSEDEVGVTDWDWGDAYNNDLHVQCVAGKMSNVGQWYTFTLDLGELLNKCVALTIDAFASNYVYTFPQSLILRYMGLSAEVIGSELEVEVDYIIFYSSS